MSEPIRTDYTKEANPNSLQPGAPLSAYRLMYWMVDILKNFFANPINFKDERLQSLLWKQDDDSHESRLHAVFDIGAGYSPTTVKAHTTPMMVVLVGDTTHIHTDVNLQGAPVNSLIRSRPMYQGQRTKMIPLMISVTTESYDGTILLAGIIEDFLTMHEKLLVTDCGMISSFRVMGTTAPKKTDDQAQAKDTYESIIQIQTVGCIGWVVDTQGPVFRGIRVKTQD
ncbi:MAG: hypothetical protein J6W57_05420 [Oscillospiraceae bacterium]|nr:hypothetical protein [Oscillospiraceae bacterium]